MQVGRKKEHTKNGDTMKIKLDKSLFFLLICFFCISLISICGAQTLLPTYMQDLVWKQGIWYLIGFGLLFFILHYPTSFFYPYIWFFYFLGNLLLLFLLFFGTPINEARCWFSVPGIGTFQPSEFMKIILILIESIELEKFQKKYQTPTLKQEFLFLCKIGILLLIPSVLTFLEPDTGVVLIYFLITLVILFVGGIRYRWFLLFFGMISFFLIFLFILYFQNQNLFVSIFGSSFFLRMDRILDWKKKSGFQLENGLASIGSSGLFGYGFKKVPLYFPEPQTDFIFAVYASNFGFLGSFFLLLLLFLFDLHILKIGMKSKQKSSKYISAGILGMLIYQQLQNIGMTFGILPITGITLPFISYGGSSLLSYMIMMGFLFCIEKENKTFQN